MEYNPKIYKYIYYNGYKTNYIINCEGKVINHKTKAILKSYTSPKLRYDKIALYIRSIHKTKHFPVHRLVALSFIPNPENKPEVNHIDGNKHNNHVSNLEWVTGKENIIHALHNGLLSDNKISLEQVYEICKLLESGLYTNKEISQIVGYPCTKGMVNDIRCRNSWVSISEKYNLPNIRKFKVKWKKFRNKIDNLLRSGFDNKYIMKNVSIPGSTKQSYTIFISLRRKALKYAGLLN